MEYIEVKRLLRYLLFSGFFISLSSSAVCPKGCMCINSNVFCKNVGLIQIPKNLSPNTEELTFINNSFTEIPTDAFIGLTKLKTLSLNGNRIERLHPYAFRGLRGLMDFSLQFNPLEEIPTYAFSGLINITNLHIGNNKIKVIHENAFSGTSNIHSLSLDINPIHTLKSHAFDGLSNVQYFTLPNGIKNIQSDAFRGLTNITYLDLKNMHLEKLPIRAFRGLSNIAGFSIRDSNITTIESGAFDGLANIEYLTLARSNIGVVENQAFSGMINVGLFKLQNNVINTLKPKAIEGILKNVKNADISNNKFGCDCNLQWLVDSSRRKMDKEPDILLNNHCIHPPDRKINTLGESDFENCPILTNEMSIKDPKQSNPEEEPNTIGIAEFDMDGQLERPNTKEVENTIIREVSQSDSSSSLVICVTTTFISAFILIL